MCCNSKWNKTLLFGICTILISIWLPLQLFVFTSDETLSNKEILINDATDRNNNTLQTKLQQSQTLIQTLKQKLTHATSMSKTDSSKKMAFVGNIDSYRLGGGEFFEITKQLFAKPIIMKTHKNNSLNQSNNYVYKIDAIDLIESGENTSLFNIEWCVCNYFLGWIAEWKMDIILWNNIVSTKKNKKSKYYKYLLQYISSYDVLFIYSSKQPGIDFSVLVNNNASNLQYVFHILVEAEYAVKDQKTYGNNTKAFTKWYSNKGWMPIIVDVWGLTVHDMDYQNSNFAFSWQGIHSLPSITWHYKYPMKWMENIVNLNKCKIHNSKYDNKILVFVARRCHAKDKIINYIKLNKNDSVWEIWHHNHNPQANINYIEFYCKLSITKYVFHFENYISAGQTIGEAAVFGIPTFGYSTKYLQSMLMPRFLFIGDPFNWEELIQKMEFLETHPWFYNKLSLEIKQRAKELFVDSKYNIDDFITDVNNTLS